MDIISFLLGYDSGHSAGVSSANGLTIKSGSFVVPSDNTGERITVTHGFNDVPDCIAVFHGGLISYEPSDDENMFILASAIGINSKYENGMTPLGNFTSCKSWIADDGTEQFTLWSWINKDVGIDNMTSTPYICAFDKTTFDIGGSSAYRLMPGGQYSWIAICNAGNSVEAVYSEAEGLSF